MNRSGLMALLLLQTWSTSLLAQSIAATPPGPKPAALEAYLKDQAFQLLAERKRAVAALEDARADRGEAGSLEGVLARISGRSPRADAAERASRGRPPA